MVHIKGLLVEKDVTYFGDHYLNLCFLLHGPILFLRHLPPMAPESRQISHLDADETPR